MSTIQTIDYRLKSYYNNDGKHLIRGYLIGTKPNLRNWSISKNTVAEKVKKFIGADILVDRDLFNGGDGHVYADSYEELLRKQKASSRGKVTGILGPFAEEDGHVYYDFEGEIIDKAVSQALAAGILPYNVSPFIWPIVNGRTIHPSILPSRHNIEDWLPVHIAIVKNGAFGIRAALSKQCFGPEGICHNALAASRRKSRLDEEKSLTELLGGPF